MAKRGRKEKDNWKKKRRQEYLEKKEFRYYIFCEGQATEPKYFQGFKRYIEDNPIYRDMVLIEIEGCQAETMRVIGKAEEYVRENKITKGQIWCVYDKDSFPASDVNGVVQRAEVFRQHSASGCGAGGAPPLWGGEALAGHIFFRPSAGFPAAPAL